MTKATASPRITSSAGAMAATAPTQFVVGGNYVKQERRQARRTATFRISRTLFDDLPCRRLLRHRLARPASPVRHSGARDDPLTDGINGIADPGASPRGDRSPGLQSANPIDPASDFRPFAEPARPVQLRAVQLHPDPARALRRCSPTCSQELGDEHQFLGQGDLEQAQVEEPGRAAAVAGRARRPATTTCSTRSTSTSPIRSIRSASHLDETNYVIDRAAASSKLGPRRFDQTVNTIYGVATLDGSFDARRPRMVLGRQRQLWPQQGQADDARQHQCRQSAALRSGRSRACAAAAGCVPFNLFGGAGTITPGHDRLCQLRSAGLEQAERRGTSPPTCPAACSSCPAVRSGVAAGVEYRDLKGQFDPDPIVAAGFSSDIPAQPTEGSYDVKEAYAEINAPLLADKPFADLLELTGAVRFSDYSTSGSTTTFKAGANWKPIEDLRLRATWAEGFRAPSIGELFGTVSRFDQRSTIPARRTARSTGASASDDARRYRQLHAAGRHWRHNAVPTISFR